MPPKAPQPPLRRNCGTMPVHMMLLEKHPEFRARQFKLEEQTAKLRSTLKVSALKQKIVKVVVNVVYKTAAQNIPDAQIKSQIVALNKDFGATNPDKSKVPAPWKGLVTDTRIRFKLAKITRTQTTKNAFIHDDGVKKASTGGIAPFNPATHLNFWVCALDGGLLGYAQFPGGPPHTDGVVINYQAFGTMGTATAPFNKGRTATHEVGHYFNLRHIWGDTEDCSGSDMVADTPNAAGPNFNKPTFPSVSCNNGPNGCRSRRHWRDRRMSEVELFPGHVSPLGLGMIPHEDLAKYSGLELLQRIVDGKYPAPPIAGLLNFTLTEVGEGRAVFRGLPGERHLNPLGGVHGGWAATIMDFGPCLFGADNAAEGRGLHDRRVQGEPDAAADAGNGRGGLRRPRRPQGPHAGGVRSDAEGQERQAAGVRHRDVFDLPDGQSDGEVRGLPEISTPSSST